MSNENKYSIEQISVVVMLSVIGIAFIAMIVTLIRRPEVSVQLEAVDPVAAVLVERSTESVRNYNKPLSIHTFNFQADPYAVPEVDSQHEDLVPDAPEERMWTMNAFDASSLPLPPGPVARKESDEEEDGLTGGGKERSGWGWLADDIMSSRKGGDARNVFDPNARKKSEEKETADQEELDQQDEEDQQQAADRKEERELMGPSALLDMDSGRDSLMNPLHEMENERDNRDNRSDLDNDREKKTDEMAKARGENPEKEADRDTSNNALEMRDPFARNDANERPEFGSRDWRFGESDASSFRPRVDEDASAAENQRMDSIGSSMVDVSGRIVGDAVSDSSRLSSGWSGYASDSIFNGGGGYTPQGVQAVGSEPLFSGAGVFGGGVGSVLGAPIDSSSGGISPIGGSSFGELPSSGSSIGNSSFDDTPKTPSALPW